VSAAPRPVYLNPGTQAMALGTELARLGFTTEVLTGQGHQRHPCVVVDSGPARIVTGTGYVYAAPDQDGCWWFWSPSPADPIAMEAIAPLSDVSVAADTVARAITLARATFPQAG
jgi:hypothetical protein